MNFKSFLITIGSATIVSWIIFFGLLFFIDPILASGMEVVFFYLVSFIALSGLFTIVFSSIRRHRHPHTLVIRLVKTSFRQSLLFATLLTLSLILLSQSLFTWWATHLLILGLGLVEFLFQSFDHKRHTAPVETE